MTAIDTLMKDYGPGTPSHTIQYQAYLGDRLIGLALAIECQKHGKPGRTIPWWCSKASSNEFMASQITQEWGPHAHRFTSYHSKGTAVEYAIWECYQDKGMAPITLIAQNLLLAAYRQYGAHKKECSLTEKGA